MIYTVTLNPAIDYILRLPTLREGETNRAASASLQFGGKGINVSRVLRELGVDSTALGFAAGFTGEALTDFLTARGIGTRLIPLPEGHTRINVKLKTAGGVAGGEASPALTETEINTPGPAVPPACLESLMERLDGLSQGDILVLAGSVPPSLPRDIYRRMLERVAGRGVRTVVDAEGALLTEALPLRPFLVKPNRAELEGVFGRPLPTEEELRVAAAHLRELGAENVLVSLGAEGALLLDGNGVFHREAAPAILPVNTVGAGDSMVAGFLAGLSGGYAHALRLAVAAGSATAAAEELATGEAIRRLASGADS